MDPNAAFQYCGSGSAWGIDLAVLEPDPDWECGSRSRSMEKLNLDTDLHWISFLDPDPLRGWGEGSRDRDGRHDAKRAS
jgi:hypothetical protein